MHRLGVHRVRTVLGRGLLLVVLVVAVACVHGMLVWLWEMLLAVSGIHEGREGRKGRKLLKVKTSGGRRRADGREDRERD